MNRVQKLELLKPLIRSLTREADPQELVPADATELPFEFSVGGQPTAGVEDARSGLDKLLSDHEGDISDVELDGLEAIVLKQGRPVVFVRGGEYERLPAPWTSLNATAVRQRLQPLMASIGRVELPNSSQIPYGGTGWVVGPNLLMTNRHVAALFATGLGRRGLIYTPGDAGIDFRKEVNTPEEDRSTFLTVSEVVMIHPFWDMALLRVAGLPSSRRPLRLSSTPPEELVDQNIVVVGYPAMDRRNDLSVQMRIFGGVFDVKRLQPGKIRPRASIRSFESTVPAITHDASTLGGNSGSALVNVATGEVVGLHFAGLYLRANYAVPTFDLARDPRVIDAGVNFAGRVPPTRDYDAAWTRAETETPSTPTQPTSTLMTQSPTTDGNSMTWTIPLNITVSVGTAAMATPVSLVPPIVAPPPPAAPAVDDATEAMQVPVIHPNLSSRAGYDPGFLALPSGEEVPMPELTAAGRKVAAKLDDGSTELKYHRFSVVLHKTRRLALFTAANVDWREESRQVDGKKPNRDQLNGFTKEGTTELWVTDPRIPEQHQLPDLFFTKDKGVFDRGHIVRRDDVAWGEDFVQMQRGNGDTFHTPNCSPQVAKFNQSSKGKDNWGDLENMIGKATQAETVCILAGPVLADDDRKFDGVDKRGPVSIKIPKQYWKIVVANNDTGPQAFGFLMTQDLSKVPLHESLEFVPPQPWTRFLVSIEEIEGLLNGWVKLTWYKEHDAFESPEGVRIAEGIEATN